MRRISRIKDVVQGKHIVKKLIKSQLRDDRTARLARTFWKEGPTTKVFGKKTVKIFLEIEV